MTRRRRSFVRLAAALLAAPSVAAAQAPPPVDNARCLTAYEDGQRLRKKHQLRAARDEFHLCAQTACPAAFRPECQTWLEETEQLLPTVVLRVESSEPLVDPVVAVDGVLVQGGLDGVPLELDPGEHDFELRSKGRSPSVKHLSLAEGEKSRTLTFVVPATEVKPRPLASPNAASTDWKAPTVAPATAKTGAWLPWTFVGVGAVALGSFAYFGATGLSKRHDLETCNPYCTQADIDSTRRRFLLADLSLGVSLASLAIATYVLWPSGAAKEPQKSGAGSLQLSVTGGTSATFFSLAGGF